MNGGIGLQQKRDCLRSAIRDNIGTLRKQRQTFDGMAQNPRLSDEEQRVCRARADRTRDLEQMYNALRQNNTATALQLHNKVSVHDVEQMELMCGKRIVCAVINNTLTHGKESAIYVNVANETKADYEARSFIFKSLEQ